MDKIIVPKQINFDELVKNSNTTLSLNVQTKMIDLLTEQFTEDEQKWYVANLYVYMNYHPTNDYPINLEHVFKMIGFAHKKNAKRTLENNFVEDEDYKILLLHREKQKNENRGGHNDETIMLNVDTFKNLCMMARTDKGKEIRKYYVKLENIYNEIIKEEIEEQKLIQEEIQKQLKEKDEQLIEQNKEIEQKQEELEIKDLLIKKKDKQIKEANKKIKLDYIYVAINDGVKNLSKIGITENIIKRNDNHLSSNPGFKYVFSYQSKNNKLIENCVKSILAPFIYNKAEWFNVESEDMIYIVEFFIDMFDRNNGSEDYKNIIDFINRLKKKTVIKKENELIPKELYDDFFEECLDVNENPEPDNNFKKNHKYKCTLVRIQQKLDEWLIKKNYKFKIKNNHDNYLVSYKNDILKYIKTRFDKELTTISIRDVKNDINLTSYLGFIGFRMKCDYENNYYDNDIYVKFIDKHLYLDNTCKITTKEILEKFEKWIEDNNIQSNIEYKNLPNSLRSEFSKVIESKFNIKASKKIRTSKYNGYGGFIGIGINFKE